VTLSMLLMVAAGEGAQARFSGACSQTITGLAAQWIRHGAPR